ncbi:MAG: transglycosylase domain-containing protein [Defluviitaleaceae bacterium]|nr:transglycosylase domain-containing protein [Defluviitaleaceae bacterium]
MDYSLESSERRLKRDARVTKKITHKVSGLILRVCIAAILIGGFAVCGAAAGLYFAVIKNAPSVNVQVQPKVFTSIIYDSKTGGELQEIQSNENRIYVTIDQMPDNLKNAFVAIEDQRFYQHDGIDYKGMVRAVVTAVQSMGGRTEGASTITQQLIKNNVMKRSSNTWITKLQEQYMAVEYEKELEKPENLGSKEAAKNYILEVYLNSIPLGHNYYGVQAAARNYFNKDASDLTLSECAVIASITQNPSKYIPDTHPDQNRDREVLVLQAMLDQGYITQAQYDQAYNDNVYDRVVHGTTSSTTVINDFYSDALISQVSQDLQDTYNMSAAEASNMIYYGGLQIFSAHDQAMQDDMDAVIQDESYYPASLREVDVEYDATIVDSAGKTQNLVKKATVDTTDEADQQISDWKDEITSAGGTISVDQAFEIPEPQVDMVIIDYHTGLVKAISGGRGPKTINRGLNRATSSPRQPGSVFKILASYAPALDMGLITPATLIEDSEFTYNGYTPHNWWGDTYKGWQSVRAGITQSMNILAVKNMVNTGIANCYAYLKNFGFTTLVDSRTGVDGKVYSDIGPATALGGLTDGVTQLELTAAYACIANGGQYIKPSFYTKVLDHDGKVLLEHDETSRTVISSGAAYCLTSMMEDVIRNGVGRTGSKAAFVNSNMPEAGKTGTTTATVDLTFVGYTPYYVAGIWTGYDMPKEMTFAPGENSSYHLTIWRDVMEKIHEDLPYKDFDVPDSVTYATVCHSSGLLASDYCKEAGTSYQEVFVVGTQPTDYCNVHTYVEPTVEPTEEPTDTAEPEQTPDGQPGDTGLFTDVPVITDAPPDNPPPDNPAVNTIPPDTGQPLDTPPPQETLSPDTSLDDFVNPSP